MRDLRADTFYQIYAYLRSQENTHPDTDGMLLHPSIGESVCEHAIIQGHKITFTTVNLAGTHGFYPSRVTKHSDSERIPQVRNHMVRDLVAEAHGDSAHPR